MLTEGGWDEWSDVIAVELCLMNMFQYWKREGGGRANTSTILKVTRLFLSLVASIMFPYVLKLCVTMQGELIYTISLAINKCLCHTTTEQILSFH